MSNVLILMEIKQAVLNYWTSMQYTVLLWTKMDMYTSVQTEVVSVMFKWKRITWNYLEIKLILIYNQCN